jgi:hypothetical protein
MPVRFPFSCDQFMSEPRKPNNLRTALILAALALMFFVGVFVRRMLG